MAKKGDHTVGLTIRASCSLGNVGSFPKLKEARGYKLTQVTIYLHTVPAVRMDAARVPLLHVLSCLAYRQLVPVLVSSEQDIFN
jgi:hypothetical protein